MNSILKHHQHDSLLKKQANKEERQLARQEYVNEKNNVLPPNKFSQGFGLYCFMNPNPEQSRRQSEGSKSFIK